MKKYKNIFDAIYDNNIEAVKTFLPRQLNFIEYRKVDTPLQKVCYYGYTEIARLLLDYGADIEATNKFGWTALHYACMWGHTDMVCLLLDRGADINAKNSEGKTGLHLTCYNKNYALSEYLVTRGADPLIMDNNRKSSLYYAYSTIVDASGCSMPHRKVLQRLRSDYLMNKHVLEAADTTAALSSGWEMEM